MISRKAKAAYYVLAGPLMRGNAMLFRHFRVPKSGVVRVHLGPGQNKYIPGWINIDANMFTGKCDVWADLRNPLPFDSGTVDAIYSHHMVEHLPDLPFHFRDALRCLKPGGVYRVGGPNGDNAISKFLEGDTGWFGDFPDKRKSIGGRLENFVFCRGEHLTILTSSFLDELLSEVGFSNIRKCLPARETYSRGIFNDCLPLEEESDFDSPHTLIIEAAKPLRITERER
jgi:predicted SAM-dependent methyltransferase